MLNGTLIARSIIRRYGKLSPAGKNISRIYTEKRAKGTSTKIFGRISEDYAKVLVRRITEAGGLNARISYTYYHREGSGRCGGVRFETEA